MADFVDMKAKLRAQLPAQIQIDFDAIFPQPEGLFGFLTRRANQERAKLLRLAAPVLEAFLKEGEVVRAVSASVTNPAWEPFLRGVVSYSLSATTLVVTDRRILLIHTDRQHRPRSFVNQVRLDHIKKVSTSWLSTALRYAINRSSLHLKLGRGGVRLTHIRRSEAKAIQALLSENPKATLGLEALCPVCGAVNDQLDGLCVACGAEVKSPAKATLRSLLLPGLGEYYLGEREGAGVTLFVSVVLWLILVGAAVFALAGETSWLGFKIWLGVLTTVHVYSAALTRIQSRKGMYSLDGQLPSAPPRALPAVEGVGGTQTPVAIR